MRGRWPSHKRLPKEINEFFLAKDTGWTLEYIRTLPVRDYDVMVLLLDVYNKINNAEKSAAMQIGAISGGL